MTLTDVDIDPSGFDRRFLVQLFIVHPTIAPSEITSALGLEAHFAHIVGEPRRTPKGNTLPGSYPDTRWRHSIQCEAANQWFVGELEALVNRLDPHKAFFNHLVDTGGSAELIIQFLGDGYFGDSLPSRLLTKIGDLRLSLGIEVYTDPQSL
jgi:hypothetical protein